MKKICILGSTGSIGRQALDAIDNLNEHGFAKIEVLGICAKENIELLEKQIRKYRPQKAAVIDTQKGEELKIKVKDTSTTILTGSEAMEEIAAIPSAEQVLTATVGISGLKPTLTAIHEKKDIALANKETLVSAGRIVMAEVKKQGVKIIPVDSEHSAIFQSLAGNNSNQASFMDLKHSVKKIILTASGGPFLNRKGLEDITPSEALKHPKWNMGKKISIDSATMMNKAFEVIEARWLFNTKNIDVVIHPQSIIHSMVCYLDNSIVCQMSNPDMRIPIQYALTYPNRFDSAVSELDFSGLCLGFEKPDSKALGLAKYVIDYDGTSGALVNAVNEVLVELFLENKIKFNRIVELIYEILNKYNNKTSPTLEDIIEADKWGREEALKEAL